MAIHLTIVNEHELIVMQWVGEIDDSDSAGALQSYATHPDARAGQNILSDMSGITHGYFDLPKRLALQTSLDRVLSTGEKPRTIVYYAPHDTSQRLATQYAKLWESTPLITAHVVSDEAEALNLLNLPYDSMANVTDLLK